MSGGCRNGNECRWLHEDPPPGSVLGGNGDRADRGKGKGKGEGHGKGRKGSGDKERDATRATRARASGARARAASAKRGMRRALACGSAGRAAVAPFKCGS